MTNEQISAAMQRQSAAIPAASPEQKAKWAEEARQAAAGHKARWDALTPERQKFEQDVENLRGEMHALRDSPPEKQQGLSPRGVELEKSINGYLAAHPEILTGEG